MAQVQEHLTPADWDRLDREVFAKDYAAARGPRRPGLGRWRASPGERCARSPAPTPPMLPLGRLMARRFDRARPASSAPPDDHPDDVRDRAPHPGSARRRPGTTSPSTGVPAAAWATGSAAATGPAAHPPQPEHGRAQLYTTPVLHVRDGDGLRGGRVQRRHRRRAAVVAEL